MALPNQAASFTAAENKPFGLFRRRNESAFLQRWHLMKSLWKGKKRRFLPSYLSFVSAPIQNSAFLNTDSYINNSWLHVIFLVAGISFYYHTKHVPSFLGPCQTTVSLMTHAKKSSDPLRGVNKPQGAFLLLDATPHGISDPMDPRSVNSFFAVDWVVDVKQVDIWNIFWGAWGQKPFKVVTF